MSSTRAAWIQNWENDLVPSDAARRSAARSRARQAQEKAAPYYGREATARIPQVIPQVKPRPVKSEAALEVKPVSTRRLRPSALVLIVIFAALVLGAGVVCPVLLNSAATNVEATVGRLEKQQRELTAESTLLSAQVSALSSPDRVAEEATKLGLQPASSVHYLQVDTESAVAEGDATLAGR